MQGTKLDAAEDKKSLSGTARECFCRIRVVTLHKYIGGIMVANNGSNERTGLLLYTTEILKCATDRLSVYLRHVGSACLKSQRSEQQQQLATELVD